MDGWINKVSDFDTEDPCSHPPTNAHHWSLPTIAIIVAFVPKPDQIIKVPCGVFDR